MQIILFYIKYYTMYNIQCTMYIVHTLYTALYNVQYIYALIVGEIPDIINKWIMGLFVYLKQEGSRAINKFIYFIYFRKKSLMSLRFLDIT